MANFPKAYTVPTRRSLAEKIAEFAWFVLATLLMLDMREALDAATTGDKSDAAYKQGM